MKISFVRRSLPRTKDIFGIEMTRDVERQMDREDRKKPISSK